METVISTAKPQDAEGIVQARKLTWLATYPNAKHKITRKLLLGMGLDSPERVKKTRVRIRAVGANSRIWVAKNPKGEVVGFCMAYKKPGYNYLGSMYILPTYQHKGIGSELIGQALAWFGNKKKIVLSVAAYNKKAIQFYRKHGFVPAGPDPDVPKLPDGRTIPSIRMERLP